jgi:hypothetical protein
MINNLMDDIMERVMFYNEQGRAAAEQFVVDTVHDTIPHDVVERLEDAEYHINILLTEVERLETALDNVASAMEQQQNAGFFKRLFGGN